MTTYTIIGYKPNGVDSVMGCVQDRVDSDFLHETFIDRRDDAAQLYSEMQTAEPYSTYMAHEWEEIIVLFNGLDQDDYGWDIGWKNRDPEAEQEVKDFFDLAERKRHVILDNRIAEAERKRKKAEADKKREKTDAAKKKEKAERAQYEVLKAKFEN